MKYLGIDYGKKKVGLAISEGMSASALKIIDSSSLEDAVQKVLQVIKKEEIDQVIIGRAESGESRSMTNKFIEALEKQEISLLIWEETLSSKLADEKMRMSQVKKSKIKGNDAIAAAIILQDYLDMKI